MRNMSGGRRPGPVQETVLDVWEVLEELESVHADLPVRPTALGPASRTIRHTRAREETRRNDRRAAP
jgi:hypothetical protein